MIIDSLYFHKSVVEVWINRLQVRDYQSFAQYLLVKDHIEAGIDEMTMKESLRN
jgi:hypothetical protein